MTKVIVRLSYCYELASRRAQFEEFLAHICVISSAASVQCAGHNMCPDREEEERCKNFKIHHR